LVLVRVVVLVNVPAFQILLLPAFWGQLPKIKLIAPEWRDNYKEEGGSFTGMGGYFAPEYVGR